MDDKQFRATVEYNIQSLLTAERQRCEEIVLKGERRRIIEQIREERDTYWKERVRKEVEEGWRKELSRKDRNEGSTAVGLNRAIAIINEVFKK